MHSVSKPSVGRGFLFIFNYPVIIKMISIDSYAYNNRLKAVHPGQKVFFAVITLFIALISPNIFITASIFLVMTVITVFLAGTPLKYYIKLMTVPLFFLAAGLSAMAVTITNQPVDFIAGVNIFGWNLGVTTAGMKAAATAFSKTMGSVSCLYFLSLTTSLTDITAVLRKIHFPAPVLDLLLITYRFIFVLMNTAVEIFTAQKARLGYTSISTCYHSLGCLLVNLLKKTYQRSSELFTALLSRGYSEELRVLDITRPFSRPFFCLTICIDALFVAMVISSWR